MKMIQYVFTLLVMGALASTSYAAGEYGKKSGKTTSRMEKSKSEMREKKTQMEMKKEQRRARVGEFSSSGVVKRVQTELNSRGYNVGKADGIMGPKTRRALEQYQQNSGLPATGRINMVTLDNLEIDIEEAQEMEEEAFAE